MKSTDLTLRPIVGRAEIDLFRQLPYLLNEELADDLDQGRRRPEWMWVALRGGRLLARAAWWSRPGDRGPLVLDILDVDDGLPDRERERVGLRLLRTAMATALPNGSVPPEYSRFVPPDWREDPATEQSVRTRLTIVTEAGARPFVERLRFEWLPGTALPGPSTRLSFRRPRDGEELLGLMTRVLDGTLDAHGREDLRHMSAREAATRHYTEELARYTSPRDWWRIAALPEGEPVGFVVPAHNGYNAIIAYIAVLPGHRGHGYVDDLLAEGTRVLAERNVPRVRASTDLGNTPMANAFRRVGYVGFGGEINLAWS